MHVLVCWGSSGAGCLERALKVLVATGKSSSRLLVYRCRSIDPVALGFRLYLPAKPARSSHERGVG